MVVSAFFGFEHAPHGRAHFGERDLVAEHGARCSEPALQRSLGGSQRACGVGQARLFCETPIEQRSQLDQHGRGAGAPHFEEAGTDGASQSARTYPAKPQTSAQKQRYGMAPSGSAILPSGISP